MDKIVKFYSKDAAQNPDAVLEQAVGNYGEVIVIGYDHAGVLDVRSSTNWTAAEILFAIEVFKRKLIQGDYRD